MSNRLHLRRRSHATAAARVERQAVLTLERGQLFRRAKLLALRHFRAATE
jgi:hypothetical protein